MLSIVIIMTTKISPTAKFKYLMNKIILYRFLSFVLLSPFKFVDGNYFRVFTLLKPSEALRAVLMTIKHRSDFPSLSKLKT